MRLRYQKMNSCVSSERTSSGHNWFQKQITQYRFSNKRRNEKESKMQVVSPYIKIKTEQNPYHPIISKFCDRNHEAIHINSSEFLDVVQNIQF